MRARGHVGRWAARGALALLAMTAMSVVAAPGAQAAAPNKSITPFLNCYWDNNDNTVTVSLGFSSNNAGTVSVPVGGDNKVTLAPADRGQPISFANGTHDNVWAFTVSYTEISAGINWQLTGNTVAVNAVTKCATKPMPADGNGMAVLAFAAVATVVGGYCLNGRSRSRRSASESS